MAEDLLGLATELVDVPSVSHEEAALADLVEQRLAANPSLGVLRVGDNVVGATRFGLPERLVVAGHLDTVPPAGNERARLDGDVLYGLGSADMKGTVAVMLDLASTVGRSGPAGRDGPAVDVTWCFYSREEVGREHSGLAEVWAACPELLAASAAILGEPTDCLVEAGCQGTLRAVLHLGGRRAHTARPFTGRNAIHRLGEALDRVVAWPGREVELDGCRFAEQLQAVAVEGGVANNVVPDHATLTLNHRYAPDRTGSQAVGFVQDLLEGVVDPELGDRIDVADVADGAPPALTQPLLGRLLQLTGAPPRAKVGWTDVATFWAHGVPAVNFGAGDPLLAHRADEHVGRASLERARHVLATLVTSPG